MRRITVLIASALINASTIPGLAAESTLNKDVNPAPAVSATVHGKPVNAADNEKTCISAGLSSIARGLFRVRP